MGKCSKLSTEKMDPVFIMMIWAKMIESKRMFSILPIVLAFYIAYGIKCTCI